MNKLMNFVSFFFYNQQYSLKANMKCRMSDMRYIFSYVCSVSTTRLRLIVGLVIGVVSIVMSLRVDRMYDQRLTWTEKLQDKDSPEYLQLEYESSNAVSIVLQTVIDLYCFNYD